MRPGTAENAIRTLFWDSPVPDIMPYSHHSHSGQFCKHASGSLEEVVLEAIRQGFEMFGLTEHVPRYRSTDLYPEEVCALVVCSRRTV